MDPGTTGGISLRLTPQSGARGRVLPVEEMAGKAAVVGVAVVVDSSARRDDRNGMIYTDYRLRFSEVWKGNPGDAFILMKAGGRVGDRATAIAGQDYDLKPGESLVVFASASSLGHHTVMGLRQGLYRVGPGPDRVLQRESERGSPSATSPTLAQLKEQVFKSLGKAVPEAATPEAAPAADRTASLTVPKELQPGIEQTPPRAASTTSAVPGTRGTLGVLAGFLLFASIAWVFLRRRHGRA